MTTKSTTKPAGPALEEPMTMNMDTLMETLSIDWLAFVGKFAIGYVYFMLGFIAFDHLAYMLMIMTNMVWLQYIIAFAVLCCAIYLLLKTAPAVATATYDAIDYVVGKAKSFFESVPDYALAAKRQAASAFGRKIDEQPVVH